MISAIVTIAIGNASPFIVPPPFNRQPGEVILTEGFEATGDYDTACAGEAARYDYDGMNYCPYNDNAAAASVNITAPSNFSGGAQATVAPVVISSGMDERAVAIDAFGNCTAGDTVTATIYLGTAAGAACTCTYGTNWCTGACGTDDLTAADLSACLNACTGIDSTSTTDPSLVDIDPTEGKIRLVLLTESDGTCSTVTNGSISTSVLKIGATIDMEFDGVTRFTANGAGATLSWPTTFANSSIHQDGAGLFIGSGSDAEIVYATADTPDTTLFAVGTDSEAIVICQKGDIGFDFAHADQTNPTIFGHSANQSTTEWWSLTHDATNGVLDVGTGVVSIPDGVSTSTLTTTTLEENLTAGACTAGKWRVDNTTTRELCRCNDAGSAYDCVSVTTANGPSD